MAKQVTKSEPVNSIVADVWPDLKRKKWPQELGPQLDQKAIDIGLASCGDRATKDAIANAMRARPTGATNGEIRLLSVIMGGQPNEHRNQLATKLVAGTVKMVSGEMKTPLRVFKGKGNETRNGQTVIVIALPAKATKATAKATKASKATKATKATAKATKASKATAKASKASKATEATRKAAEAHLSQYMKPTTEASKATEASRVLPDLSK